MSEVQIRERNPDPTKPGEGTRLKIQRANQNMELDKKSSKMTNPVSNESIEEKKAKIMKRIEADKKSALLLAVGHFLYE